MSAPAWNFLCQGRAWSLHLQSSHSTWLPRNLLSIVLPLSLFSLCWLLSTYGLVHILATQLSLLLKVLCLPPSLSFLSHERILIGGFIPSVISSTSSHHSSTSVIRVAAGSFKLPQEITNTYLFCSMYFCFKVNKWPNQKTKFHFITWFENTIGDRVQSRRRRPLTDHCGLLRSATLR